MPCSPVSEKSLKNDYSSVVLSRRKTIFEFSSRCCKSNSCSNQVLYKIFGHFDQFLLP